MSKKDKNGLFLGLHHPVYTMESTLLRTLRVMLRLSLKQLGGQL